MSGAKTGNTTSVAGVEQHHCSIPLSKLIFDEEMKNAAIDALRNERFVMGESVFKFEEEFARYCGTEYAVSTSSGTDALHLSLRALGIGNKTDVVTTPLSFVATANAIIHAGAVPIFADIDMGTYNIDPNQISEKITRRTKAVMPVHLYGHPAYMESIMEIARTRGIKVVEDACQAHGAEYKGLKVGAIGDAACFSFYPSKNMTVCGDGGMVVTNDEKVAATVAKLRDCGRETKHVHGAVGYTARLNTVNAAIGRVQLTRLDGWNERRRSNAKLYHYLLSDLDGVVRPPLEDSEHKPVFHLYVIRAERRDKLKEWLEKEGIQCGIHYPVTIPMQPVYQKTFGFAKGKYPKSELVSETCLSLPMHPHLKREDIKYVCEKIHEFY